MSQRWTEPFEISSNDRALAVQSAIQEYVGADDMQKGLFQFDRRIETKSSSLGSRFPRSGRPSVVVIRIIVMIERTDTIR